MKTNNTTTFQKTLVLSTAVTLALLGLNNATASTKYWDTAAGTNNGVGGSGTWGTTFSNAATGDATLSTAAITDDAVFQGTAGTITLGANQTANTLTFNTTGYTITPDATTARGLAGPLSLAAGINLNLNDSATTANRTLNLNSNLSGGSGSTITIQGAQAAGAASRVNLNASGVSISVPITLNGSSDGVVAIVATATNTSLGGIITNNSTAKTGIGATSGNAITLNAKITGSAGLQFSAGDNGGAGTVTLNAVSDYQGATTFNAANSGVVKLGIDNALPSGTDVTMAASSSNGGILDLNGHDLAISSLTSGVGGGSITNGATGTSTNTLTISGSTSPAAFGLVISDGATRKTALTRSGTGTTTLSGANTYTGTTTVSGGTLLLGAANRIADTSNMVLSGGKFATGGFSETVGALTLSANSIIDMGAGASILHFAASNTITWSGILKIYNYTGSGTVAAADTDEIFFGSASGGLTASQLTSIQFYSGSNTGFLGYGTNLGSAGQIGITSVPEPSTYIGGGLILGLAGWSQRKRFRHGFCR